MTLSLFISLSEISFLLLFVLFYFLTDIRELNSSQRAANVQISLTASVSEIYPVQGPHKTEDPLAERTKIRKPPLKLRDRYYTLTMTPVLVKNAIFRPK